MVEYEWDVEQVDLNGEEIIDHHFCESFEHAKRVTAGDVPAGQRFDVVLVRDDAKGREWAYLENGKLPEYFEDAFGNEGSRVPKRFHTELTKQG